MNSADIAAEFTQAFPAGQSSSKENIKKLCQTLARLVHPHLLKATSNDIEPKTIQVEVTEGLNALLEKYGAKHDYTMDTTRTYLPAEWINENILNQGRKRK